MIFFSTSSMIVSQSSGFSGGSSGIRACRKETETRVEERYGDWKPIFLLSDLEVAGLDVGGHPARVDVVEIVDDVVDHLATALSKLEPVHPAGCCRLPPASTPFRSRAREGLRDAVEHVAAAASTPLPSVSGRRSWGRRR